MIGLSAAMFFSPCLEIETFYFTAGSYGWRGILTISLIYLLVTVTGIVTLVVLGARDWRRSSGTGWNTMKNKSRASPWWGWAFLPSLFINPLKKNLMTTPDNLNDKPELQPLEITSPRTAEQPGLQVSSN